MNYIIVELQTTDGVTSYLVTRKSTRAEAEAEYYRVLAAAAVSTVETHAATILTAEGFQLMHQAYHHAGAGEQE